MWNVGFLYGFLGPMGDVDKKKKNSIDSPRQRARS